MKHIVSVDQFDKKFIDYIFKETDIISIMSGKDYRPLAGKVLTNLFYEPSTRTSSSFYSAMTRLGGNVIPINEVSYSSVSKGETLEDTIKTMGQYSEAIVLRHYMEGTARRASDVSYVPIINAGDGKGEHPTQALLDLYTITLELKNEPKVITLMGDLLHGRTVHSLSKLIRIYFPNVKLCFVSPSALRMPKELVNDGDEEFINIDSIINQTDVLYMTRIQKERLDTGFSFDTYKLTKEDINKAKRDMIVMHPLPRVDELPTELDSDPRCVYFKQIKYGLYIRMALLKYVMLDEY